MIHVDSLTQDDILALDATRGDICVSIYLPTTPVTSEGQGDRIVYKNLVTEALKQLHEAGTDKRRIWPIEEELRAIEGDADFWAHMADGLAVFATPERLTTYRLPISPKASFEVADSFHIKPLVPVLAFSGECFVLSLARGGVKLIEVTSKSHHVMDVADMPKDLSDAVGRQMPRDPAPTGRIQGQEGMRVLSAQYARRIDKALRRALRNSRAPLILASTDELAAIYREQNSYPHLASDIISGNPEETPERVLAEAARKLALAYEKQAVAKVLDEVKAKAGERLSSTNLQEIAKAATFSQIRTLVVKMSTEVTGMIDEATGKITRAKTADAENYDVLDEIVGLTLRHGGEVLPSIDGQLPADKPAAAIYRFAM